MYLCAVNTWLLKVPGLGKHLCQFQRMSWMVASGLYRKMGIPHEGSADNICRSYLYLAANFGYKLPSPPPSPSFFFFAGLPNVNKEPISELSRWRSSLLFLLVPRGVWVHGHENVFAHCCCSSTFTSISKYPYCQHKLRYILMNNTSHAGFLLTILKL